MGFLKVFGISVAKALKNTGITVGVAAATAGGLLLQNPEVMAPIWAATGFVGPVALIALSIAGQAIVDAVKHKDAM